ANPPITGGRSSRPAPLRTPPGYLCRTVRPIRREVLRGRRRPETTRPPAWSRGSSASDRGVPNGGPRLYRNLYASLYIRLYKSPVPNLLIHFNLQERVTGVEPTTATLATWRSTTELHPHRGHSPPLHPEL